MIDEIRILYIAILGGLVSSIITLLIVRIWDE